MWITSIKFSFFIINIKDSLDLTGFGIKIIIVISFFIDILVNLNTGFYEKGQLIKDR